MNTGAPWPTLSADEAEARVLGIQTKLHQWATGDPARRFGDLYNLICDSAFLLVAWRRVRGNKGARTAGVDGQTARYIERERGEEAFLADVRAELKARRFTPLPVRERQIPKPGGKGVRRRPAIWPPAPMSGSWRRTSPRALTRSTMPRCWRGCDVALETSASWHWSRHS